MGTLADATLTRIETLSANEALLQSRLGECVNLLRNAARMLDACKCPRMAAECRVIASYSEAALRTVEARHDSPSAGQIEGGR